jgi:hypothetical protein
MTDPSVPTGPCPHAATLPGHRTVCDDCARQRGRQRSQVKRDTAPPRLCRFCEVNLVAKYCRTCDDCQRELRRDTRGRWLAVPDNRAKQNASRATWAARNPDYRRRWLAERWRDPAKRAADLEVQRMSSRLWREKHGLTGRPVPESRYPGASPHWRLEPHQVEELRHLVRLHLRAGGGLQELGRASRVSARLLYRLLHEQESRITVAAADRVAMALGLHLDLVA